uniref:methyl-accepting chemotaxis protein n=1 Tax=Paludibacterium denitrificans TaxID=2675226 RepID=UPI002477ECD1|nr:methyl-accepting chemotaxis protein [Paludibacterium denitrificans]
MALISKMPNRKRLPSRWTHWLSHIGDIASNAQTVHERSGESLTHSEQGRQSLARLQSDVNQVEKAVQLMAQEESELVSATASITEMTRQVRDIADQTNLLALNAAIEAARAG